LKRTCWGLVKGENFSEDNSNILSGFDIGVTKSERPNDDMFFGQEKRKNRNTNGNQPQVLWVRMM
jgi:hypothetical protein